MSAQDYDPNSINAMFSRIMERLDSQDHLTQDYRSSVTDELGAIRKAVEHTNGRVTDIEADRQRMKGFGAAIAAIASIGWAAYEAFGHLFNLKK
jgi:hypothetical protein